MSILHRRTVKHMPDNNNRKKTLTLKNKRNDRKTTHKHTYSGSQLTRMSCKRWNRMQFDVEKCVNRAETEFNVFFVPIFEASHNGFCYIFYFFLFLVVVFVCLLLLSSTVNTFLVGHISSCLISLPTPFGWLSFPRLKKMTKKIGANLMLTTCFIHNSNLN